MSMNAYRCESSQKVNEDFLYVEQIPKRVKYHNKLYFFNILCLHPEHCFWWHIIHTIHYFLNLLIDLSLSQVPIITFPNHKWENSESNISSFSLTSGVSQPYYCPLKPNTFCSSHCKLTTASLGARPYLDKIHRPFSLQSGIISKFFQ